MCAWLALHASDQSLFTTCILAFEWLLAEAADACGRRTCRCRTEVASTSMSSADVIVKVFLCARPAGYLTRWLQSLFRSAFRLPDEPKCQRCLGLMIFTMLMWAKCSESRAFRVFSDIFALDRKVLEAAPFEATAMLPRRV